jgi:hypothetical protein
LSLPAAVLQQELQRPELPQAQERVQAQPRVPVLLPVQLTVTELMQPLRAQLSVRLQLQVP